MAELHLVASLDGDRLSYAAERGTSVGNPLRSIGSPGIRADSALNFGIVSRRCSRVMPSQNACRVAGFGIYIGTLAADRQRTAQDVRDGQALWRDECGGDDHGGGGARHFAVHR